jgi:hypothetical protein
LQANQPSELGNPGRPSELAILLKQLKADKQKQEEEQRNSLNVS